ncbi:hypothetical protein GmRootV35_60240 [Variovorax sp. V35]
MLAVSQGLPIKCFAVGAQKHPFTFFSLAKNPVRKPADLIGKKVGIPSTAAILLRALLAKNKIAEKDVTIITVGSDMVPLLTGEVDVGCCRQACSIAPRRGPAWAMHAQLSGRL